MEIQNISASSSLISPEYLVFQLSALKPSEAFYSLCDWMALQNEAHCVKMYLFLFCYNNWIVQDVFPPCCCFHSLLSEFRFISVGGGGGFFINLTTFGKCQSLGWLTALFDCTVGQRFLHSTVGVAEGNWSSPQCLLLSPASWQVEIGCGWTAVFWK